MTNMVRLLEPLIPALRRYARALVRDRSAADDLVQDALERALSRWNSAAPMATCGAGCSPSYTTWR
jgi:RNA polymerase sigma-70 factor (ECF subfamily)